MNHFLSVRMFSGLCPQFTDKTCTVRCITLVVMLCREDFGHILMPMRSEVAQKKPFL